MSASRRLAAGAGAVRGATIVLPLATLRSSKRLSKRAPLARVPSSSSNQLAPRACDEEARIQDLHLTRSVQRDSDVNTTALGWCEPFEIAKNPKFPTCDRRDTAIHALLVLRAPHRGDHRARMKKCVTVS